MDIAENVFKVRGQRSRSKVKVRFAIDGMHAWRLTRNPAGSYRAIIGIAEFAGLEFAGLKNDGLENDGVEQEETYILHTMQ